MYKCSKCKEIGETDQIKYLGRRFDKELNYVDVLISFIALFKSKLLWGIRLICFMRKVCPMQVMRSLYFALIHIKLEYGIG